ncbi:MAG: HU family DNA-binding protein [Nitrospinales bacterium]|nr:HU family DNA-binding protein [Nitrospinales bacterium]
MAHNPRSGEWVEVPAKKVPFFKAGNDLRKMVDG